VAVEPQPAHDGDTPRDRELIRGVLEQVRAADHPLRLGVERIGAFRIIDLLGEGGMGVVYRAEQDNPRREVALKVMRPDRLTPSAERRFKREAEALARLQHPGIAQVFEAGLAESGVGLRPFFAMELIDGEPLTSWAETRELPTAERLALLARICDAVQHAHERHVVHRDLKPANIVVDAGGQPRILDFGVARATDCDTLSATRQTDFGQMIGTLLYMSPEQVQGDPREVDARSDVYALGVVAYELLTGRLPYDVRRKSVPEAGRIIREEEPTPLSRFDRSLRGDIELIIGKCLA
jgi:serine/threonine protein kinase